MALATWGVDPPLFTDQSEPTGGVPSLSSSQITQIYQYYGGRNPDANELATDGQSALKYSAAGVERQIATRFSNTPGSGITGNEGPSLTVKAPISAAAPRPVVPQASYLPPNAPAPDVIATGPPAPTGSVVSGFPNAPTIAPPAGLFGTANPSQPFNYATRQAGAQFGYGGAQLTGATPAASLAPAQFGSGLDMTTLLILAAVGIGAFFLLK